MSGCGSAYLAKLHGALEKVREEQSEVRGRPEVAATLSYSLKKHPVAIKPSRKM